MTPWPGRPGRAASGVSPRPGGRWTHHRVCTNTLTISQASTTRQQLAICWHSITKQLSTRPLSVNWLSASSEFDNICAVFPGWHCNNMIKWFVQDLMADNETSSLFCKYGVISCWHYDLLMLITGRWWLSLEWYFMNISKYQSLASPHCPVAHNGTLCILSNN